MNSGSSTAQLGTVEPDTVQYRNRSSGSTYSSIGALDADTVEVYLNSGDKYSRNSGSNTGQ
jgi:hypothetical protein